MFTTQLPFPALDMLRQADTPTGLPTGSDTTAAQLALIAELVALGLARSVSTPDGQPGVQTTADGRVEMARLDASYYSDVNATTGQASKSTFVDGGGMDAEFVPTNGGSRIYPASNGNFGAPANPDVYSTGGFVTPGADVIATTGQASKVSAATNGVSAELADAITAQPEVTQVAVETAAIDSVIEVAAAPEEIPVVAPVFTGITEAKITAPADDATAVSKESTQPSKSTAKGK